MFMDKDRQQQRDEHQLHKDKVEKKTVHLENEEIERMPDSDDDYRLPRELPESDTSGSEIVDNENVDNDKELMDESTDISPEEIALLEESEIDDSSDETRASAILDNTDEDGDELNEGPDEDNLFDTGADLDMPDEVQNPDMDADEDKDSA